jgi:hypothetical protein
MFATVFGEMFLCGLHVFAQLMEAMLWTTMFMDSAAAWYVKRTPTIMDLMHTNNAFMFWGCFSYHSYGKTLKHINCLSSTFIP